MVGQQVTHCIIGSLIFQPDFKTVLDFRIFNGYVILCVLFIILFIDTEINLRFERTDIKRISHSVSVLFIASHQLTAAVALEAAEYGNTFFMVAFLCQLWNIQDSCHIVDGKVKTFHHTSLHQSVHEKFIPAPMLCQQVAFHLPTSFAFQLQQCAFFLIG